MDTITLRERANLPPYIQEAEEAVIGALISNTDMIPVVAAFLTRHDFYLMRHGYIWQALVDLVERGDPVDLLTVSAELDARGQLDECGGSVYLMQTVNNTPTSIHAEFYGRMVEAAARRRRLLKAADEIKALALDEEIDIETVEAQADAKLMDTRRNLTKTFISLQDASREHFDTVEDAMLNPRELIGIDTGLRQLNKLTRGYRKGRFYLKAGRPGMGKSSSLLTDAANMARCGLKVAFFTLEMGAQEVTNNLIAAEMGIAPDALEQGNLDAKQWDKYVRTQARVNAWPIYMDDSEGLTPMQLRMRSRMLMHDVGIDAIFIDYVQLMSGGSESKYSNRDQELGYITRSLKGLSKALQVPVIAAAQISRAVDSRADKHPTLSDLRESGNLEQDADVVMLFYRDDYYNPPDEPNVISPTDISVAKNRTGPTGALQAGFWGEQKKFVEIEIQTRSIDVLY